MLHVDNKSFKSTRILYKYLFFLISGFKVEKYARANLGG